MTSVVAHIASAGQGVYGASKHAALGLTKAAAVDYAARGIRVTAVSPGLVDTPMTRKFVENAGDPAILDPVLTEHPMGRSATVHEGAAAIAWLLSDQASFTTGSDLLVDGGFVAH